MWQPNALIWIEAHPDFNVPLRLLNNLIVDQQRRLWITYPEADEDTCDIIEGKVQEMTEVKIAFPMPHNILTRAGKTISNVQFYEMDHEK